MQLYRSPRKDSPFSPPFLQGHGAFVCDQDLALTVRIQDLKRWFGGLFLLDSGLHVADVTEAPRQAAFVPRNRKGPWFYLKTACYPLPNSAAGETESGRRPCARRALSISAPSNEHDA